MAEEIEGMDELQEQLETDQQRQTVLENKEVELKERIEELQTEEAQAKKLCEEAQGVYENLARKHSAEDLRKHLQTGEPCPVCDQIVNRVPKRLATAGLDDAKYRDATGAVRIVAVGRANTRGIGRRRIRDTIERRTANGANRLGRRCRDHRQSGCESSAAQQARTICELLH